MEKLARIVTDVFVARHSHVRVKRCYRSKISKGGFIKVTSGLIGPMRKGDTIRCLSNGRKGVEGFTTWFKGVQGAFRVIPTQLRSQRYNALEKINRNKINTPSWCWNTTIGVHLWIHHENFKTKFFDTDVKSDLTTSSSQKIQFWRWHVWNLTWNQIQ
jgi:hypothetical protein